MHVQMETPQATQPWERYDDAVILNVVRVVIQAARSLIPDFPDRSSDLECLASHLEQAIRPRRPSMERIFWVGPHTSFEGRLGVTLLEMILDHPGPDPFRTARVLIQAVRWRYWPRPDDV